MVKNIITPIGILVGESLKLVGKRFLDSGMSMVESYKRMDMSVSDRGTFLRN